MLVRRSLSGKKNERTNDGDFCKRRWERARSILAQRRQLVQSHCFTSFFSFLSVSFSFPNFTIYTHTHRQSLGTSCWLHLISQMTTFQRLLCVLCCFSLLMLLLDAADEVTFLSVVDRRKTFHPSLNNGRARA